MMTKTGENGAAVIPPRRTPGGRFGPGCRPGPGRPRGRSLTSALREIADPDELAARLVALAHDARSPKIQLAALQTIFDRLDGRAVSRSVVARAENTLPINFRMFSREEKIRFLDEIERRGSQGTLALVEGDDNGGDDE